MATHSSVLAWRIPGTVEPGGLLSMGSQSWTRLKQLSSSSKQPTPLPPSLTPEDNSTFIFLSVFQQTSPAH